MQCYGTLPKVGSRALQMRRRWRFQHPRNSLPNPVSVLSPAGPRVFSAPFLRPADNVIRAGLTPKLRDTEVLCASLTYGQGLPDVLTGAKSSASPHLAVYRPPFRCAWQLGSVVGIRIGRHRAEGRGRRTLALAV